MRFFVLGIFCLAMCGCAPTQQQIAAQAQNDDATCQSFGAKIGSDAYIQCRMSQQQQRTQLRAAAIAAPADTCTKFGNTVSCY